MKIKVDNYQLIEHTSVSTVNGTPIIFEFDNDFSVKFDFKDNKQNRLWICKSCSKVNSRVVHFRGWNNSGGTATTSLVEIGDYQNKKLFAAIRVFGMHNQKTRLVEISWFQPLENDGCNHE